MKNFARALHFYNRTLDFNSQDPEIYNAIALLYQDNEEYIDELYNYLENEEIIKPLFQVLYKIR